ncbi:MAG: DUF6011 domain-containing protein [Firmicutes bacterium]|nr:DUF6011 domain-containing protein [Bacillota bacterium]
MESNVRECARCGRKLKDPKSIAREIGPKCWRLSGGGVFDKDLDVDELEWMRREKLLQDGGEIDLGANWRYVDNNMEYPMRVSIRYRSGLYEVYGFLGTGEDGKTVVFTQNQDLKSAYRVAVEAGPMYTAMTYRTTKRKRR